jgi:hypothetical protein
VERIITAPAWSKEHTVSDRPNARIPGSNPTRATVVYIRDLCASFVFFAATDRAMG